MAGDLHYTIRLSPFREADRGRQPFQRRRFCWNFNHLRGWFGGHFRTRRRLQLGVNRDMFRCFDSEPYAISTNFQDCDFDVVGQYDFLVFLTTDYKHSNLPLKKVPSTLRRATECKKYTQFAF